MLPKKSTPIYYIGTLMKTNTYERPSINSGSWQEPNRPVSSLCLARQSVIFVVTRSWEPGSMPSG